jgi:hypothetical protein
VNRESASEREREREREKGKVKGCHGEEVSEMLQIFLVNDLVQKDEREML